MNRIAPIEFEPGFRQRRNIVDLYLAFSSSARPRTYSLPALDALTLAASLEFPNVWSCARLLHLPLLHGGRFRFTGKVQLIEPTVYGPKLDRNCKRAFLSWHTLNQLT